MPGSGTDAAVAALLPRNDVASRITPVRIKRFGRAPQRWRPQCSPVAPGHAQEAEITAEINERASR
jgi:hypothetical protein